MSFELRSATSCSAMDKCGDLKKEMDALYDKFAAVQAKLKRGRSNTIPAEHLGSLDILAESSKVAGEDRLLD